MSQLINTNKRRTTRKIVEKVLSFAEDTNQNNSVSPPSLGVAIVSSYPPRQCGIATYTLDLQKSLARLYGDNIRFKIFSLETGTETYLYNDPSVFPINSAKTQDYRRASTEINRNSAIHVVFVQHEFGLFSKNEAAFNNFLADVQKPIYATFHTVLPNPSQELEKKVVRLMGYLETIVVMTENSKQILMSNYHIPSEKISCIPHGTHLVAPKSVEKLKHDYCLKGKTVLTTFGLLGPGKSIETTLKSLPSLITDYPNIHFLILGKTHPELVKSQGEVYRNMLKSLVKDLNLANHVTFVNEFLELKTLLEYLQLTDIYLFTSKDPNQAVSGTFVYALSCGCAVISTPIPHAQEVHRSGAGKLVGFDDVDGIVKNVDMLLRKASRLEQLKLNALTYTSKSSWENSALKHGKLFGKHATTDLQPKIPQIKFDHLKRITDEVGVLQFCKQDMPDYNYGYTLDDNARALITVCKAYALLGNQELLPMVRIYFNYIRRSQQRDGMFLNYVDKNLIFSNENFNENLEDANGRVVWALGTFLNHAHRFPPEFEDISRIANELLEDCIVNLNNVRSPRAMAFIIKGLYASNICTENSLALALVLDFSERLNKSYEAISVEGWEWFEKKLTYANAVLPEALLLSSELLQNESYRRNAIRSMNFLLKQTVRDNQMNVISNVGWKSVESGDTPDFQGGEQPIDVGYSIVALDTFATLLGHPKYVQKLHVAYSWFLGNNALELMVYNPCTGGCHDGLEKEHVNLNQGAESTICHLLARVVVDRYTS